MAVKFKRQRIKRKHINVIPLINVIFLLLIFFIVTGTQQEEEPQEIAAPYAESGKEIGELPIKLVLTLDGLVILNNIPITPRKLYKELRSLLEGRKENTSMIVMADAKLDAAKLLHVIADIERAGVSDVSLVTKGL